MNPDQFNELIEAVRAVQHQVMMLAIAGIFLWTITVAMFLNKP